MSATTPRTRLSRVQRQTLRDAQREALGSSVMSGVCDNYIGAFAVFLEASAQQLGWVVAIPQLIGAWAQLGSVWLARHGVKRVHLIVAGAAFQAAMVALLAVIAIARPAHAVTLLIVATMLYQVGGNVVQPQWRALMVLLVPVRRRGRYFARRSRISAVTSFAALAGGGLVLHLAAELDWTAAGFAILFLIALIGRLHSVRLLADLDDPQTPAQIRSRRSLGAALAATRRVIAIDDFRRFTLFVACMQGTVAIAGPFFSVHMLRNLGFSYVELMANMAASIVMQLLTLGSWGYISDRLGNRVILVATAFLIPLVPLAWVFSDNFWYLLGVQALAGLAWGGFSLSSTNYLYDLRPHGSELAPFAAVQAVMSGTAVFIGALAGGWLATAMPASLDFGGLMVSFETTLYGVFAVSAALRFAVALWFTPRVAEIRLSHSASVNEMIYRFARFNPVTGVVMDIIDAVRRTKDP